MPRIAESDPTMKVPSSPGDLEMQKPANDDKSPGFRFKRAAQIAFITLASVLGAVAVGAGIAAIVALAASPVGVMGVAGTVAIVAASILLGLLLLKAYQLISPHLPNWMRIPLNYVQSLVCGIVSAVALAVLFPFNLEKRNPTKEQCNPDQTPILMIHGFLGSSNNWLYHRHRMQKAGLDNLFTVNLGNPFHSIDTYAQRVHQMVLEIKEKTGRNDLQIVCHSMGGLVARHYNEKYAEQDGVTIKDIVTLGTPLAGTRVAWLTMGMSKAGRQMFPNSDFVQRQREAALKNETTHHYHIASKCDYVIRPLVSATLGDAPNTKVDWLDGTGHISYLFSDAAADKVIHYLQKRNEETLA